MCRSITTAVCGSFGPADKTDLKNMGAAPRHGRPRRQPMVRWPGAQLLDHREDRLEDQGRSTGYKVTNDNGAVVDGGEMITRPAGHRLDDGCWEVGEDRSHRSDGADRESRNPRRSAARRAQPFRPQAVARGASRRRTARVRLSARVGSARTRQQFSTHSSRPRADGPCTTTLRHRRA